jgi:hypothetical protein
MYIREDVKYLVLSLIVLVLYLFVDNMTYIDCTIGGIC